MAKLTGQIMGGQIRETSMQKSARERFISRGPKNPPDWLVDFLVKRLKRCLNCLLRGKRKGGAYCKSCFELEQEWLSNLPSGEA